MCILAHYPLAAAYHHNYIEIYSLCVFHDAGNGLKDPTAPIGTLRRSGYPYPHNKIQWEYNGFSGENRRPFKGQQASPSNPVIFYDTEVRRISVCVARQIIVWKRQLNFYRASGNTDY